MRAATIALPALALAALAAPAAPRAAWAQLGQPALELRVPKPPTVAHGGGGAFLVH
jgi:hypothetical protein